MPIVSVIIPIYNPPKNHLHETLKSVFSQTFQDFEVIIIDDGSSLIVELGAGCGVLGMGLAAAAASTAAEETSDSGRVGSNQSPNQKLHIILTDHDNEWLQRNVALNETLISETSPAATMEVTRLDWRNPHDIETVQHRSPA